MKKIITTIALVMATPAMAELPRLNPAVDTDLASKCHRAVLASRPAVFKINFGDANTLRDMTHTIDREDNYESHYNYTDTRTNSLEIDGITASIIVKAEFRWHTSTKGGWEKSENKKSFAYFQCDFEGIERHKSPKFPVVITSYYSEGEGDTTFLANTQRDANYYDWVRGETIENSKSSDYRVYHKVSTHYKTDYIVPHSAPTWDFGDPHEAGSVSGWVQDN